MALGGGGGGAVAGPSWAHRCLVCVAALLGGGGAGRWQVLVFCPTRRKCETTSQQLAEALAAAAAVSRRVSSLRGDIGSPCLSRCVHGASIGGRGGGGEAGAIYAAAHWKPEARRGAAARFARTLQHMPRTQHIIVEMYSDIATTRRSEVPEVPRGGGACVT
jgi:hypothetical protein